jgi:DNA-binding MarR family transcriptional regulator
VIWNGIKSEEQKKLLIGIANEKQPQIYSQNFIAKYELKTLGHVRKAIKSLERMGLIEGNRIWDIFFREWVKRNFYF